MELPQAFRQQMAIQLGELEAKVFFESLEQSAPTSVQINLEKPAFHSEGLEAIPWNPNGYYLPERPVFTLDPFLHAGAYYV